MTAPHPNHRPLGKTGLSVPPIFFRGDVLENSVPLPDQTKRVICAEWLKHVAPPVAVTIRSNDFRAGSLRLIGDTLRRLDVPPDEVLINFEFDIAPGMSAISQSHEFYLHFDDARHLLGSPYAPSLVTLNAMAKTADLADEGIAATVDVHPFREVLERWASQNGSARKLAIGVALNTTHDLSLLRDVSALDYVHLKRGPNIFDPSTNQMQQIKHLDEQGIGVTTGGIFGGGYLLGGPRCNGHAIDTHDPTDQYRLAWRKAFTSVCHGHGVRPAHACIQFALTIPGVTAVSLPTSHPDRVAENVQFATMSVPPTLWASMQEEGLLDPQSHLLG